MLVKTSIVDQCILLLAHQSCEQMWPQKRESWYASSSLSVDKLLAIAILDVPSAHLNTCHGGRSAELNQSGSGTYPDVYWL
jgi:hypothetical protein